MPENRERDIGKKRWEDNFRHKGKDHLVQLGLANDFGAPQMQRKPLVFNVRKYTKISIVVDSLFAVNSVFDLNNVGGFHDRSGQWHSRGFESCRDSSQPGWNL
jgi:hypothetical protein